MFTKGLSEQTQKNLALLSNVPFVSSYYLAGGTALSLHFGHRYSHDLDFFSENPEKSIVISGNLKNTGSLEIFQNDEGTFNGQLNGVKLSFFVYPYRLLRKPVEYTNVKIASVEDIGCMKIDAISSRGTKRDFIDLYFICKKYPLPELLALFQKKFEGVEYSYLHICKSLVYFEDAEHDLEPEMLKKIEWKTVKEYFLKEVPAIITSFSEEPLHSVTF